MKILLDTCAFLWIISDDPTLSHRARELFLDANNSVYLSAVSAWEIAIKNALGKLPLPEDPERFIPKQRELHGIQPLPFDETAALQLIKLPLLHKDPFDRMLICQAVAEGAAILTPDDSIRRYPVRCIW